jgi:hypothetical protein
MDYDSLVVSLNSHSSVVSFNELSSLLLTHEQRIHKHALSTTDFVSTSVFPINLVSITSAASASPQANLASSFIFRPSSSTNDDLMA